MKSINKNKYFKNLDGIRINIKKFNFLVFNTFSFFNSAKEIFLDKFALKLLFVEVNGVLFNIYIFFFDMFFSNLFFLSFFY